jgi:hypothetical protein
VGQSDFHRLMNGNLWKKIMDFMNEMASKPALGAAFIFEAMNGFYE